MAQSILDQTETNSNRGVNYGGFFAVYNSQGSPPPSKEQPENVNGFQMFGFDDRNVKNQLLWNVCCWNEKIILF